MGKKKIIIAPKMIGPNWVISLEKNITALCEEYDISFDSIMEQINNCKDERELNNLLEEIFPGEIKIKL